MSRTRVLVGLLAALLFSTLLVPLAATASAAPAAQGGFVVNKAEYNRMFPHHKKFYSYASLKKAMKKFPAFAHTGNAAVRKREAAAFLANVSHETGGLKYIVEQNKAAWSSYCDDVNFSYGCPAYQSAYHGRGPLQLSWNFNYKAASTTPSASTCCTTPASSRRTPSSPGRRRSGSGCGRRAPARRLPTTRW